MKSFLQRFGSLVLGILNGFDRIVFRGKLRQLYAPEGMNIYLSANGIKLLDYRKHVQEVTRQVLAASLVEEAKRTNRFDYLPSTRINKEQRARAFAERNQTTEGLVCVLQCVEPCWSFDLKSKESPGGKKRLAVVGEERRCSHLYHYYLHPVFGWMYLRLQTWFPFEVQVYVNGREWLVRQMDREGLKYERCDNKILWVEDWQRAQQLMDQQLQTNWSAELDAMVRQAHPLHPQHLGQLPVAYNWTFHQTEWATDVAFADRDELKKWYDRWLRQAMANFDSAQVLRFLGHSQRLLKREDLKLESELKWAVEEGLRIKHWVDSNSLKMYDFANLLRLEMTINRAEMFASFRAPVTNPEGPQAWRKMQRSVADVHRRAEVGQAANNRYLEALSTLAETKPVKELAEPLCERVAEPGKAAQRQVRGLNPLGASDGALLQAIADPRWMVNGVRNRDLVAALYPKATKDAQEKRRRSARVTRLIRILRGHGLLRKLSHSHRYQVPAKARNQIHAILASRNANCEELMTKAA